MLRNLTFVVLIAAFGAQNSFADSISVTAGTMTGTTSSVADVSITAESLSLSGTATTTSSVLRDCVACDSGSRFKLNGWWDFDGEVTVDGTTYDATGRFRLNSRSVEIPTFSALDSGVFTQAFHFVGQVNATDGSAPALRLLGRGLATINFVRGEAGTIVPSLIRYDFDAAAQTPEPATLLLVGSGLAGALAARRRTRKA